MTLYEPLRPGPWLAVQPLILASRSEARIKLLGSAGIPTEAHPSKVDERAIEQSLRSVGTGARVIALALARAKALNVAQVYANRLVLGADQIMQLDGEVLHKVEDRAALASRLRDLSGRRHTLYSAGVLVSGKAVLFSTIEEAVVTFRPLSVDLIARYLEWVDDSTLGSVGGYEIERFGIHLVDRVDGDHATVMGLPMLPILRELRGLGLLAQ